MSTPAPFTPSTTPAPFMQPQHARTTRKPLRSSPLAGPALSRSSSQTRTKDHESTPSPTRPPELNEAERMIALNVHGAFDSWDALKPTAANTFLAPPRPAHMRRGAHSRSMQEVSRLRPRPVSLYSAPTIARDPSQVQVQTRNHRRSFLGLTSDNGSELQQYYHNRSLPALGEVEGRAEDSDRVHGESEGLEELWALGGRGGSPAGVKFGSDQKLRNSTSRTDLKASSTPLPRPRSILLNSTPSSSSLATSSYSTSPSPPASPNSTVTSLSLPSTSPRSSSSNFLSLPPTSSAGDASWLTQNTYNDTPKFTRLGLGAPGVVMPVPAKGKASPKTSSTPAATQTPPSPATSEPITSTGVSRRNSFMATLSASLGRQRSVSTATASNSNSLLQISESGEQQAGSHTSHTLAPAPISSPTATQTQISDSGGNERNMGPPRVLVATDNDTDNEAAEPVPANNDRRPQTITSPAPTGTQPPPGAAPPTSSDSSPTTIPSLSNSQSLSSDISSSSLSSSSFLSPSLLVPTSPTPSLTRSSSASSSASSLPIRTPPSEVEVFSGATSSELSGTKKGDALVDADAPPPPRSTEAGSPSRAITDEEVVRALQNAQCLETSGKNLGSSRSRSRLGFGKSLEQMKSWTTAAAASSSARKSADIPKTSVAANISSTPTGVARSLPAPASVSGRAKRLRPFSQALVEEEESDSSTDEGGCEHSQSIQHTGARSSEVDEQHAARQDEKVASSTRSRMRSKSSLRHLHLAFLGGPQDKEMVSAIPRSQSETAIRFSAQSSSAVTFANGKKDHVRRGSIRRMWDTLLHRDSASRNSLS